MSLPPLSRPLSRCRCEKGGEEFGSTAKTTMVAVIHTHLQI